MTAKHIPTDATRQTVQLHATVGTPQDVIARVLGIDAKTLRLHYRDELDLATARANATIGGALFNKAKNGDTAAQIFWMKTRAGWKDTTAVTIANPEGETFKIEDTGAGAAKLLALIENIAERRGTAG